MQIIPDSGGNQPRPEIAADKDANQGTISKEELLMSIARAAFVLEKRWAKSMAGARVTEPLAHLRNAIILLRETNPTLAKELEPL